MHIEAERRVEAQCTTSGCAINSPCLLYHGVPCDNSCNSVLLLYTGGLVEINLRKNFLTGSLPVAMALLPIVVSAHVKLVPVVCCCMIHKLLFPSACMSLCHLCAL